MAPKVYHYIEYRYHGLTQTAGFFCLLRTLILRFGRRGIPGSFFNSEYIDDNVSHFFPDCANSFESLGFEGTSSFFASENIVRRGELLKSRKLILDLTMVVNCSQKTSLLQIVSRSLFRARTGQTKLWA